MSFVSVNSERNTTKKCALFLLACAMVNISMERKRENSLRENVKNVDALTSVSLRTISFFYLYTFECLTHSLFVVWLQTNIDHCIPSGFLLLQKEAKTRE